MLAWENGVSAQCGGKQWHSCNVLWIFIMFLIIIYLTFYSYLLDGCYSVIFFILITDNF